MRRRGGCSITCACGFIPPNGCANWLGRWSKKMRRRRSSRTPPITVIFYDQFEEGRFGGAQALPPDDELTNWIGTFQGRDTDSASKAFAEWRAKGTHQWLVAALASASSGRRIELNNCGSSQDQAGFARIRHRHISRHPSADRFQAHRRRARVAGSTARDRCSCSAHVLGEHVSCGEHEDRGQLE